MKEDEHDEPIRWTSIGWQALLIANRLRCQAQILELVNPNEKQDKDSGSSPDTGKTDEQRAEDERRYIDTRLREIAAWERKIRKGKM